METWSIERKALAGFLGTALVLLLVIAGVAITMRACIASSRGVWQAMELSSTRERMYSALVESMAHSRMFALTGNERYLASRDEAIARLHLQLRTLRQQTPPKPATMQQRVGELERCIEHLFLAIKEMRLQRSNGTDVASQARISMAIQNDLDTTRSLLAQLQHLQAHELALRLEADDQAADRLYTWLGTITVVVFAALALLARRIMSDLRERLAVESRLQEANSFLESLLENIPTMVFAKDADQLRFLRLNQAGEKLLGRSREALLGKNDLELFPPQQAAFFIQKDREVLALGDIVDIPEEEIDSQTLGRRVLHTRKVPIRDHAGRPRFLLGISMDITEERAAQQRVLALNEELRHHAELLESSNRELESFCYSVSHDLRAPLRAINGFTRLLELELAARLDGDAPRYLRTICSASERMGQLIDDLLEFSRIGRQNLEREPTDMNVVVQNVVKEVLTARDGTPPDIVVGDLPPARCDRRMLHLVWLNLLDNAVKYSASATPPRVQIDAQASPDEIVYSIRDNGIGFDMRYYDKLFGVFQRLHSDSAYPGTGVGLAISQRIVARHGGRIWAQSEPGKGAIFYFALPTA